MLASLALLLIKLTYNKLRKYYYAAIKLSGSFSRIFCSRRFAR